MVFTLVEILEIAITVVAVGYIFSGFIRKPKHAFDQLFENKLFDWENIKYAAMITAPAVILHELGHKFASLLVGIPSHYHMVWWGLALGAFLRAIGSGFIFFIPGYVRVEGFVDPVTMGAIAFAGPAVNLALFGISKYMLESGKYRHWHRELFLSKQINLWLFIFNMIPFGPLDGAKVLRGVLALF